MRQPNQRTKPFVVAVCGGSGSGKTTLINQLILRLGNGYVIEKISTDDYYHDLSHLDLTSRRQTNFDHPDAIDLDLFVMQLGQLRDGEVTDVPSYAFGSHTRQGTRTTAPPQILFIDGIFALYPAAAASLCDYAIFIDIPDAIRLERRLARDQKERQRELAEVLQQYETTVRPMYETYVLPTKAKSDRVATYEEQRLPGFADHIAAEIEARLKSR